MIDKDLRSQLEDFFPDPPESAEAEASYLNLSARQNLVETGDRANSLEGGWQDATEPRDSEVIERRQPRQDPNISRIPFGDAVDQNIGLRQYITPLLRWWWLILLSVVIGAVSGYVGVRSTPRVYQSRTTLMVGQALQNPNPSQSEFYTGQVLAQSYADLVRREPVLRSTLNALGLTWDWRVLQGMVSSRVVPGTQLLEISVLDTDSQRVKLLTDEIAQQLILQSPAAADPEKDAERKFILGEIEELKVNIQNSRTEIRQLDDLIATMNSARQIQDARNRQSSLQTQIASWQATYSQLLTNLQIGTPNFLSVVEPAQTPFGPVSAGTSINVMLGLAIGLVLSGGAAFVLEYIDDTIKTEDDVRQTLGLAMLGRIPRLNDTNGSRKLVVAQQPRSPIAAAYRVLRTNLQFCAIDRSLNKLMVTSASPGEGKSVIAANLAVAMAQADQHVILVDADLWRPVQHRIFELNNNMGLTAVLKGDVNLEQALQAVPVENLKVLPSGTIPPNPSDLLGSQRMGDLIEALRQQADVVIFDSPPVMADADAAILATRVDGVLFVIDSGTTRRASAQRSRAALSTIGAYLPGVALNRVSKESRSYYYYYSEEGPYQRKRSRRDSLVNKFKQSFYATVTKSRPSVRSNVSPAPPTVPLNPPSTFGSTAIVQHDPKPKVLGRLVDKKEPGQHFDIDKPTVTIGRSPGNNFVVEHTTVSRRHAMIKSEGENLRLYDLGSANGTFVNYNRVRKPVELQDGDMIRLGEVEFIFKRVAL